MEVLGKHIPKWRFFKTLVCLFWCGQLKRRFSKTLEHYYLSLSMATVVYTYYACTVNQIWPASGLFMSSLFSTVSSNCMFTNLLYVILPRHLSKPMNTLLLLLPLLSRFATCSERLSVYTCTVFVCRV